MNEVINHGLILEPIHEQDHILGAEKGSEPVFSKKIAPKNEVLDWVEYEPEWENQTTGGQDTMACVSFSGNNCLEYLSNYYFTKDAEFKNQMAHLGLVKNGKANFSDRRTAKGSGTNWQGNTVRAVGDYLRKFYFCPEDMWPMVNTGFNDYYAVMPREVDQYGQKVEPVFEAWYKYLPTDPQNSMYISSREQIWDGLQYSPVWASVDGRYQYDEDGLIKGGWNDEKEEGTDGFQDWTHRVTIRGGVWGKYWIVHDHYTNQIIKFTWSYPFGGCAIWDIKLKKKFQLVKVSGSPAVYLYKAYSDEYYAIADGEVPGGDLLKSFSGNYKNAGISVVESIPADRIVGEVKAIKY